MQAEALLVVVTNTKVDKDYTYLYLNFDNAMKAWKDMMAIEHYHVSGIRPVSIMDFEEFFDDKEEMEKVYEGAEVIRFSK